MHPSKILINLAVAVGASAAVIVAVPGGDGDQLIECPALTGCDGLDANRKREPAAVPGVLTEEETVTAAPATTATVYITTDYPVPEPAEAFFSPTMSTTGTANPPYDVVLTQGSIEEVVITTTAVVEATAITTVTAVGPSGGTSFTVMSGQESTSYTSPVNANTICATDPSMPSCLTSTTTLSATSSTLNVGSVLTSELTSPPSITTHSSKPMVTVFSTTTRQLPGPFSSTVQLGPTNFGSKSKGGNVGLTKFVEWMGCFVLALML